MLRVALLSRWHVHADQYANEIRARPDADVTAVWDEDAACGGACATTLGVPFEANLDALLVCVIEFESGAIAVNETSFTSLGGGCALEIHGTEGGFRLLAPGEGSP